MSCKNCSSKSGSLPGGCKNNGLCGINGCEKLTVFDWLSIQNPNGEDHDGKYIEVRFKNGRKDFYYNSRELVLSIGEMVTVEAKSGHDLGCVSATGGLANLQMQKVNAERKSCNLKIYRAATKNDIKKFEDSKTMEPELLKESKAIAAKEAKKMKLSYVEIQGDGSRATFFFTAETRIDFRPLIKKLKEKFNIKVDMRQLGSRQDAGRIGGIGDCGRELCCSTWLRNFSVVSAKAARYQQLSINPQRLSGQCGKLKCCLNYELDNYLEAIKVFPKPTVKLKTQYGIAVFKKMDIFGGRVWYAYQNEPDAIIEITAQKANEIISENKKGNFPKGLT